MCPQKSLRASGGGVISPALDFASFLKYMLLVGNCALNKPGTLSDQFTTPEVRIAPHLVFD